MAGRSAYAAGDFPRALDLFGRVGAGSPLYVRAKLLEGAVHVRKYDAKPAVAAFGEASRAVTLDVGPDAARLHDLANISLARTFYSTGQFDLAAKYYARIPPESIYAPDRLFENGWTDFMRGDYPAALRGVAAVRAAGAVRANLMGEATLLESAAAQAAGDDVRASAALAAFQATYPRLYEELKAFAASSPEESALYAKMAALRGGRSGLTPGADGALRRTLTDTALARRFDDVDELARELAVYDRLPQAFRSSAVGDTVFTNLTLRRAAAIDEAGSLSRRYIRRTVEELAQQIKRTIHIDYDPLAAARAR